MADRERPTKRERRERARAERREREAAAAREERRRRIVTVVVTIAVVAGVAALLVFTREPPAPTGVTISPAAAQAAQDAAGCEAVEIPPAPSTQHLDEPAPPAEQLYAVRPTDSGRHFAITARVATYDEPVDERRTTHNLEHGAVVVWYRPEALPDEQVSALKDWASARNRAGFQGEGGTGIIVAPWEGPFQSSNKALAVRAWTVSMDCDRFEEQALDKFLIENFGTHGRAPEAAIAGYPDDVLSFEDDGATPQQTASPPTPDDATPDDATPDESPTPGATQPAETEPSPAG
ncbi:MAG: DUF3105 domain-containing protein [Actinomycetota bacterium]|nr:DUF3105 domain-containing protein [Actinomycetota bacterium]